MLDIDRAGVSHAVEMVRYSFQELAAISGAPHIIEQPKFGMDGDMYFFLKGENLQNGVAGFGATPSKAAYEFDKAWRGDQ